MPWLKSLVKSWRRKRAVSGVPSGNARSGSAPNRPRPDGTVGARGAVFRMDGLVKSSSGAREKGTYIDLESVYAPSEPDTRVTSQGSS